MTHHGASNEFELAKLHYDMGNTFFLKKCVTENVFFLFFFVVDEWIEYEQRCNKAFDPFIRYVYGKYK